MKEWTTENWVVGAFLFYFAMFLVWGLSACYNMYKERKAKIKEKERIAEMNKKYL